MNIRRCMMSIGNVVGIVMMAIRNTERSPSLKNFLTKNSIQHFTDCHTKDELSGKKLRKAPTRQNSGQAI